MRNSASNTTSRDQNFFLYPIHGDLLRKTNIRIHYSSRFPLGLGLIFNGLTFGRHVYITESPLDSGLSFNAAFKSQVQLLIHELAHCKQYQDMDWSMSRFGRKYLWELCKAGFIYQKNVMESEASALEDEIDDLLFTRNGRRLFQVWRDRNLFDVLGYPIAKTITLLNDGINRLDELEFEGGVLQVSLQGCYRYGEKATIDRKSLTCTLSHPGPCAEGKPVS